MRSHEKTIALVCTLLLAFALRVWGLGVPELGGDEAFSYSMMRLSFYEIVRTTFVLYEPHPVGSYFMQHIAISLFGNSEFGVRYLSVCFGMAAIALMSPFIKQLRAAHDNNQRLRIFVAIALMAFSPFAIWHSRWGRMYSISLALTLASTVCMLALLRKPTRKNSIGYIAITWLALNVHYFAGYVIVAQNVFVVLWFVIGQLSPSSSARHQLKRWLIVQLITLALFAPWFWVTRQIILEYSGTGTSPTWAVFVNESLRAISMASYTNDTTNWFAVAACVVGVLGVLGLLFISVFSSQRKWLYTALLLVSYFMVPLALIYFGSRERATFSARYLIPVLPPFLASCAFAIVPVKTILFSSNLQRAFIPKLFSLFGCVVLLMTSVLALQHYYGDTFAPYSGWRDLARTFDKYQGGFAPEQSRVVCSYPDPAIPYYYDSQHAQPAVIMPVKWRDEASANAISQQLAESGVRRVVLQVVDSDYNASNGRDGIAQRALAKYFTQIEEWYSGRWIVRVYARISDTDLKSIGTIFKNGVEITSAWVNLDSAGNLVEVHLKWSGDASALTGNPKMFIHVQNIADPTQLVSQQDVAFTSNMLNKTNSFGLRLPENVARGQYRVYAGLYDPNLPNAPRILTRDNKDLVELAQLEIR